MKIVVTIHEETPAAALDAIRELTLDHDMIELRIDPFRGAEVDLRAVRAATTKPIILTNRGGATPSFDAAHDAGIDFVDVEYAPGVGVGPRPYRIVLSHHDYDAVPDLVPLAQAMLAYGCAYTKIAVTPRRFAENRPVLAAIAPGFTLIGMGERGLYSRILAPFRGSELAFVSRSDARSGAPGQISLERALAIYGDRNLPRDPKVFAVAGNPAGHSLSPSIHNPLFREHGVSAAYTIASADSFDEVAEAFLSGEITGLSITAPFKDDALRFVERIGATVATNAREAAAVNTLVRRADGSVLADNTDVDGFATILGRVCGRDRKTAALVGAGGTARAALAALRRAGVHVIQYNRTPAEGVRSLDELRTFDGEIVINATPAPIDAPLEPGMAYIEAAYHDDRQAPPGVDHHDGIELLHAQAVRQNELFREALHGLP